MKTLFGCLIVVLVMVGTAWAVNPSEKLADPVAEARAEEVGKGLRCLVCQSESIEESDADLARDLRTIVRERVVAGDSNQQILDYVVSRYGDYVLLKPPFKSTTLVLWMGPLVLLGIGILLAFSVFRRRQKIEPDLLSEDESRRLKSLIEKDKS